MDKKKPYFKNLDGFRFFCFLAVFLFHGFYTRHAYIFKTEIYRFFKLSLFGNGSIGVNFFFVLSGFLITYFLILEKKETGKIELVKFWKRRILRIWPLFYLSVGFGFVVFPLLKSAFGEVPNESASLVHYLLFINNFDLINNGFPDASILSVLWSVAVEEQFYFLWPIILSFIPIRKWYLVFFAFVLESWIFRFYFDTPLIHEVHTLSCIGDMAIGGLGAWLITEKRWLEKGISQLPKWSIVVLYAAVAGVFLFCKEIFDSVLVLRVLKRSVIAVLALAVILEQNYAVNSLFKFSNFKTISKLGIVTYGLYCLHFIGILIANTITRKLNISNQLWQVIFLDTALALIITIVLAKLSFHFYEKPFLKLKKKFDT